MAHLDVHEISLTLPDGRGLLDEVSFRVGPGERTALIGANGAGKTTLLNIITGELTADAGGVSSSGTMAVMPQFSPEGTIADVLLAGASPAVRSAAERMASAEAAMETSGSERHQMAFAEAVTAYGDAGGYEAEVLWDTATVAALGQSFEQASERSMHTLSGGEQKRLLLEVLLRGPADLLVLDEPDNHLDVPAKRWLEEQLRSSGKTVLFISHDRELLAEVATSIVTLELGGLGSTAWVHPGDFRGYHAAREERFDRLDELRRRWDEDRAKLRALMLMYRQKSSFNSDMASRYRAAKTRLERFETAGPPQERPREQQIDPRLRGARTAKRAVVATGLELTGLTEPFDLEVWHGDRLAVLGPNGTGKSHLLRLLAAGGTDPDVEHQPVEELPIEPVEHSGTVVLGSRVRPGWFSQTQVRADLRGRTLLEILHRGDAHRGGMGREQASRALARYELAGAAEQTFDSLSGGQRARLQILLLELGGATLLLLDEPTDHLDLVSAEALQDALARFQGTVIAVTHDRWFARDFDRFAVLDDAGELAEHDAPRWGEG